MHSNDGNCDASMQFELGHYLLNLLTNLQFSSLQFALNVTVFVQLFYTCNFVILIYFSMDFGCYNYRVCP